MRTEADVREKLRCLEAEMPDFTQPAQISAQQAEIDRLKWVLDEAPDQVRVPEL